MSETVTRRKAARAVADTDRRTEKAKMQKYLNCEICPPNRGENKSRTAHKRNHGQKPRTRRRRKP